MLLTRFEMEFSYVGCSSMVDIEYDPFDQESYHSTKNINMFASGKMIDVASYMFEYLR